MHFEYMDKENLPSIQNIINSTIPILDSSCRFLKILQKKKKKRIVEEL